MRFIYNTSTDVYFNLAVEEYLLKNYQEAFFILYQNEPSVVIGKYQHVWTEVNEDFVNKHQIKIARRFSGGGAVFQDLGNWNVTFIENGNADFNTYSQRIIDFLSTLGLQVETDERRSLKIKGLKISGSAQAIHKNRSLYHATLLFSSDLNKLLLSLNSSYKLSDFETKGRRFVESVKSPVTNIVDHLPTPTNLQEFRDQIIQYFLEDTSTNSRYRFTEEDLWNIKKLAEEKYETVDWNLDGVQPTLRRWALSS